MGGRHQHSIGRGAEEGPRGPHLPRHASPGPGHSVQPGHPVPAAIHRREQQAALVRCATQFSQGIPFLPRYIDANNKQLLYAVQEGINTANLALDGVLDAIRIAEEARRLAQEALDAANEALRRALGFAEIRTVTEDSDIDPSWRGYWNRCITADKPLTLTMQMEDPDAPWIEFSEVHFEQAGVRDLNIVAGPGVTINRLQNTTMQLYGENGVCTLKRLGPNHWIVFGAMEDE
ncbi:non-contractile tail fiber protein [Pseudomonas phage vB_Pae_S1]|nr:non-contractile tail fiber protein [Pseudomonas phage vB_Pae_S1]